MNVGWEWLNVSNYVLTLSEATTVHVNDIIHCSEMDDHAHVSTMTILLLILIFSRFHYTACLPPSVHC